MALLPPFNTLQAERLMQQFGLKRQQKTIYQLLYSLNALLTHAPHLRTGSTFTLQPDGNVKITAAPAPAETHTAINVRTPCTPAPSSRCLPSKTAKLSYPRDDARRCRA